MSNFERESKASKLILSSCQFQPHSVQMNHDFLLSERTYLAEQPKKLKEKRDKANR